METIITQDGTILAIVLPEKAKRIFTAGAFDLWLIEEETSSLFKIEKFKDLESAIAKGKIAIHYGTLSTETAKQFLEGQGYFTGNLWRTEDVQEKYECTQDQAQEVLGKALTNDATMQQVWEAIDFAAQNEGLKQIEE
jgi:hypothetical protein